MSVCSVIQVGQMGCPGNSRDWQGPVQAVGGLCWLLLLPCMAVEWGRMCFLEEQLGCGVAKTGFSQTMYSTMALPTLPTRRPADHDQGNRSEAP